MKPHDERERFVNGPELIDKYASHGLARSSHVDRAELLDGHASYSPNTMIGGRNVAASALWLGGTPSVA